MFYGILLFLVDYYFNIFQFPRVTPQPGVKATLPRWERQASPQLREGLATLPRQGLVTPLPLAPTTLPQQEGLASLQQLERHLAATHPQLLGSECPQACPQASLPSKTTAVVWQDIRLRPLPGVTQASLLRSDSLLLPAVTQDSSHPLPVVTRGNLPLPAVTQDSQLLLVATHSSSSNRGTLKGNSLHRPHTLHQPHILHRPHSLLPELIPAR